MARLVLLVCVTATCEVLSRRISSRRQPRDLAGHRSGRTSPNPGGPGSSGTGTGAGGAGLGGAAGAAGGAGEGVAGEGVAGEEGEEAWGGAGAAGVGAAVAAASDTADAAAGNAPVVPVPVAAPAPAYLLFLLRAGFKLRSMCGVVKHALQTLTLDAHGMQKSRCVWVHPPLVTLRGPESCTHHDAAHQGGFCIYHVPSPCRCRLCYVPTRSRFRLC